MSPFEVERLGWDDFNGIPIVADEKMQTGRFSLRCEGDHTDDPTGVATSSAKPGELVRVDLTGLADPRCASLFKP